uniref:Tetratricopeptide repeat protein n=1 Tax=Acrobeloides nanus TaxID=290746 RepID=A0A914DGZ3_9BILA
MDAEQFKKFRENARKLEQLNRSKPKVRPTCDRQQKLLIWEDELRKRKVQNDIVITIGVKHACCYKQSSELEAINLRDLEVPKIHASRYLVCRTITEPIYNITASVLIEDTNSDIELLELYNFQTDFNASPSWLPTGKIILIKEPYLKFTSLEQNIALQVASPSDIVFIDETDEKFLKEVGALVWFNLDKMSFEELKLQGNECYKKGNYEEALKYYSRALKYQPTSPIIHLNCAATFLALERYYEAYQAAKSALDNGADLQKALFRLGKAAYGMRDWQKSSQHFIDLIKQFPNCNDAKKELTRALARLKESRAGQFDLSSLFNQFHYDGVCYFDIADYVGPVKIANIPGKGKGLIATSDIEPGTLLTVSKAFSTVYPTHNQININVIDINSDYIISQTQLRHMIETMQVLKRNPHRPGKGKGLSYP